MKVAIYCRLSEEDQHKSAHGDDSLSIQNQKIMLVQYALSQGWSIYHIYSDDDYAGADRNRPQFKQLISDAKERKFEIILCKTQSRFTRELELVEAYIHGLFPALGIRFVSIVDNADTHNKGNKKSRQINGLVNEWYLEDMSENIRAVLLSRRKNGLHIGSFALYGYQKDPEQKGHLIIDPEAAQVVQEIFSLFSQGYGKTAIARTLNDRGIPNPTEYKRQKGLRYTQPKNQLATLWKYATIASMLENQIYIGNMVQGKYGSISYKSKINKPQPKEKWIVVEGTHEPIIQRSLWQAVQSRIAERIRPFDTGTIGIFARKVRCASCGYIMGSSKSRGKHYLQCSTRHNAKDCCVGAFISVDTLEHFILTELNQLHRHYLDLKTLEEGIHFSNTIEERYQYLSTSSQQLHQKNKEFHRCLRSLYMDRANGLLSEEDFVVLMNDFRRERVETELKITKCNEEIHEIEVQQTNKKNQHAIMEHYLHPEHLTREIVEVLIDHIVITKREKGAKYPSIEIHWNM